MNNSLKKDSPVARQAGRSSGIQYGSLTVGMSDLSGAAESADYGDAQHHDGPVDFGNVDLAVHLGGGVPDGHPRETSQCHCIADHGVCRRDHGLTGDDGCACGHHEHRPEHRLYTNTSPL
jgi:hypothetical protein